MKDNNTAFNSNEYDKKIKNTLPYYEEFYNQIIDVVNIYYENRSVDWLDVGCGTGKMAEVAFRKSSIGRFVFCDNSSDMLDIAKERFRSGKEEFVVSNVQDINFDNEFDVVTAVQAMHYLKKHKKTSAIKKCYEALKPDGLFINFENFAPEGSVSEKIYLERWKGYQISMGKSFEESEKHIRRYKKDYYPISVSEQIQIMKKCGFREVEILWLSFMQVGIMGIK